MRIRRAFRSTTVLLAGPALAAALSAACPAAGASMGFGASLAPDPPTASAVEYVHTGFGHYFVTADPVEIHALDTGAYGSAWARTGYAFKVWTAPDASTVPVCRYFTSAYAKSTHVYSPYRDECAMLAAHPAYVSEGYAFDVQLPIGAGTGSGTCPSGTTILFRLFNHDAGGAPNHRYTDDAFLAYTLTRAGWTLEGERETGAYACVPR